MKNKSYLLNGKRYRIEHVYLRGENSGYCDPPTQKNKKIQVHNKSNSKKLLEDLIHEMLHACNWDASEEWVTETAKSICNVLWDQGYRIQEQEEE